MTPEQHWAEAERLLNDMPTVRQWCEQPAEASEHRDYAIAAAQVHATLALAGATLLAGAAGYDAARDRLADAMLGVPR